MEEGVGALLVMATVVADSQIPFDIFHSKIELPSGILVSEVPGNDWLANEKPEAEVRKLHRPMPREAAFPIKVVAFEQSVWFEPALEGVTILLVMVI